MTACSEPASEEILAQHPAPVRGQLQREGSAGRGSVGTAGAPAEDSSVRPGASAGGGADARWENEHVLHVWVTGAVLSEEPVPDGTGPGLRRRGWACLPAIDQPSGMDPVSAPSTCCGQTRSAQRHQT